MLPEAFLTRVKTQLGEEYEDFLRSLERPLWLENIFYIISKVLNLLRHVLWSRMQSISVNVPKNFENVVYSAIIDWNNL